MSTIDTIRSASPSRSYTPGFGGRFGVTALMARLDLMLHKRRTRRVLLGLTDEQLKDIGLSRADAYREGLRPFWD